MCVLDLFSECWQSTLFQIFLNHEAPIEKSHHSSLDFSLVCSKENKSAASRCLFHKAELVGMMKFLDKLVYHSPSEYGLAFLARAFTVRKNHLSLLLRNRLLKLGSICLASALLCLRNLDAVFLQSGPFMVLNSLQLEGCASNDWNCVLKKNPVVTCGTPFTQTLALQLKSMQQNLLLEMVTPEKDKLG